MVASRGRAAAARCGFPADTAVSMRPRPGTRAGLTLLLVSWVSGLCGAAQEQSSVPAVTSGNWTELLQGHWMVEFYAPWCPACQQIQADWENFAKRSSVLHVKVAKVDVTEEPGLSGRFFVTKLPTIFHGKDGVFRRYHGSRMVEDLLSFIEENKWNMIEPVAGWKSPSSVLMTGMAGLFHLSGWIRQTHNYFTGPLGMPAWGSYIVFVMATLLIGLILGLILVLLIDCFCPAKPKYEEVRSDIIKEDVGGLEKDPKDSGDEKNVSDNEDVSEEDNEEEKDEQAEDSEAVRNAEKGSGEDSTAEDSGTEEEEDDVGMHVPHPSTPESESALRQRRSEVAVESEH
ncbi:PREDICTED: thioredoxin-related transmembrane protein 4 [Nanorana parkeri]|uniref:thioredoxin-related transmembrane protein 4 n=1 Tax=Nanorana parkeri TaxID=125878 RepID=UPI00085486DF|nr:PREDICTED: thioredoxin-related transmembrane protein 4 [Nanorana parkeri]